MPEKILIGTEIMPAGEDGPPCFSRALAVLQSLFAAASEAPADVPRPEEATMKLHSASRGAALTLATAVAATGLAAPAAFGRIAPDPLEPGPAPAAPTGLVRVLRIETPAAPSGAIVVAPQSGSTSTGATPASRRVPAR